MVTKKIMDDDIKFRFDYLSSANVGISVGYFKNNIIETNMPKFNIISADIPKYSRNIFHDERKVQFHISGYDFDIKSSLQRMCGEVIERYGAIMAHTLFDSDIIYDSYKNLSKKNYHILDPKYYDVFSNRQLKKIHKNMHEFSQERFEKTQKLNWIKVYCATTDDFIFVPAQMIFIGFPSLVKNEKKIIPSLSTGTAAHVDFHKALKNSLIEAIQINAFIKNWHYQNFGREVIIDDHNLQQWINDVLMNVNDVKLVFHLIPDDETNLIVVGCYVLNEKGEYPAISFGIQASTNKEEAFQRAAMEALAVYVSNYYSCLFKNNNEELKNAKQGKSFFGNLDKNVAYFASQKHFNENLKQINEKVNQTINYSDIKNTTLDNMDERDFNIQMLKILKQNQRDVFILDITPPEVISLYSVTRILIPQFFPVFIPSLVYTKHPEIKDKDNINFYIHPLA